MSYISRKEELYKNQIIPQTMEDDFVAFWQGEVEAMRNVPLVVKRKELDLPYKTFKAYEIAFNAHDGVEVTAYFCVPNTYRGEKLPCVSVYHGGGGAYGVLPDFVATGVCTFCMDCRSQGGKTIDHSDYDYMDDYHGGLMSHGLLDKRGFYMKNIYLDAVRAVDVIATLPEVDAERIVAHGQSQGGALTIVAAALSGKIKKAYPSVPSYACLDRRVENASGVFKTVNVYLSAHPSETDRVMSMLSYFDVNNMVSLLSVPTDFFLGMSDPVCLPSFVYSLYAHTNAQKKITMSPFTGHTISREYKLELLRELSEL